METSSDTGPRTALVTGASRGIGRAIATALAERGLDIAVHFRRAASEAAEVAAAVQLLGRRSVVLQADLADRAAAGALVTRTEEALGPVFALVNNAGITRDKLVLQTSDDDWTAIWDTDLVGPRALCRAGLSAMAPRGAGRIVNVSSVVGAVGNAGQANYASAKSAVLGITRQLAVEAAPSGVTVNCVVPGYIATDATSHLKADQRAAWVRRIPAGRLAGAAEVADLVVFLVCGNSGYITGQCIAVDGGFMAGAGFGFES